MGRLMEGRLCEGWVSMGEGVSICCEALRLRFRSCSTNSACGFRMECTPSRLPDLRSVDKGVGGLLDMCRSGGSETGTFSVAAAETAVDWEAEVCDWDMGTGWSDALWLCGVDHERSDWENLEAWWWSG